jgi:hypothetical protein
MLRKVGCVTAVLLSTTLCALGQTIKVNWQNRAPFHDYKTYAWRTSKNEGAHFYKQWVRKDVNAELAQKGLREVSVNQKPDLYIYYHIVGQEVMDSTTMDDGFGWGGMGGGWGMYGGWGGWGGWGGGMGPDMAQTTAEPRMMGILAVDMIDVNRKQLVWRGQATTDDISDTQKGDEKQVLKSVDKMFKQYPPPRGK